jgi:hypothetical protein
MESTGRPDRRMSVIPLAINLALCAFVGGTIWSAIGDGVFKPGAMGPNGGIPYILVLGLVSCAAAVSQTLRNRIGMFFVPLMLAYMGGLDHLPIPHSAAPPETDVMGWVLEFTGYITAAVVIGAGMAIAAGRAKKAP